MTCEIVIAFWVYCYNVRKAQQLYSSSDVVWKAVLPQGWRCLGSLRAGVSKPHDSLVACCTTQDPRVSFEWHNHKLDTGVTRCHNDISMALLLDITRVTLFPFGGRTSRDLSVAK